MERLINRDNEAWQNLREVIEALKPQMGKVRSEPVKKNVDKALSNLITLGRIREAIYEELRAGARSAPNITEKDALREVEDRVTSLEEKVMGSLDLVQEKLAFQGKTLEAMTSSPSAALEPEERWTEVVKRPRGGPKQHKQPEPMDSKTAEKTSTRQRRQPRARPLAIAVAMNDKDFPELLKTVKRNVDPTVTGDSITKMRRTQKGELLIEVRGGTDSAEKIRDELARSLGTEAKVRKLESTSPVEICDLDEVTTKEEVLGALTSSLGFEGARVVSIRKAYGGSQTAVVVLPSGMAGKLCTAGRLRVGLISARVRPTELQLRCFRCFAFGHTMRECTGTDRGTCCWRCGGEGHLSRDCRATRDEAEAFRAILSGPTKSNSMVVGNAPEAATSIQGHD